MLFMLLPLKLKIGRKAGVCKENTHSKRGSKRQKRRNLHSSTTHFLQTMRAVSYNGGIDQSPYEETHL